MFPRQLTNGASISGEFIRSIHSNVRIHVGKDGVRFSRGMNNGRTQLFLATSYYRCLVHALHKGADLLGPVASITTLHVNVDFSTKRPLPEIHL
jgi:hypothetical protein